MKNSKYIKVSVSDRLPEEFVFYLTFTEDNEQGYGYYDDSECKFRSESNIKYWIQEVPDYEDEMREMLEFIYGYGEKVEWSKVRPQLEELLTKIKTKA